MSLKTNLDFILAVEIFRTAASLVERREDTYSCVALEYVSHNPHERRFAKEKLIPLWAKMHKGRNEKMDGAWFASIMAEKRRRYRVTLLREAALNIAIQNDIEFKNGKRRK